MSEYESDYERFHVNMSNCNVSKCEWSLSLSLSHKASSIMISAVSTFLIWGVPKQESVIVILSCVFNGVSIVGWNSLDVLSTSDLFPVHLRYASFVLASLNPFCPQLLVFHFINPQ